MKRIILIFTSILFLFLFGCSSNLKQVNIIPKPQKLSVESGSFNINEFTKIVVVNNKEKNNFIAEYFAQTVESTSDLQLKIENSEAAARDNSILLRYVENSGNGDEGYSIKVNESSAVVEASDGAGMFYAVQTLLQMLDPEIYRGKKVSGLILELPAVTINDKPRFKYRGMHLDVCRHYFPVSFIKRFIDYLAMHKINTFHWHLTEDQGWRIEIKKYPKLTSIGSVRKETIIGKTNKYDGKEHGGYYTQEEVKEIVSYASERFITVIPEIEMPGHTVAALAAYPQHSCTGGPFEVSTKWGVKEDIFCAGKESTFKFLENILSEVIELFPSEYIHIGGDEAPKTRWKKCPDCQRRIRKEGLKDEHELQSYFIKRMEKFINSKGRKIIGWDEILEGGLAPGATVMSWRGIQGGIAAAKEKHEVIMAPYSHLYFDGYQADKKIEPLAIGYWAPLERVYEFEPVPESLSEEEKKYVIGAEATLWTEYIATEDYAEYMLMPRLAALAELVWTNKELRSWQDFEKRMQSQYMRYENMEVNFRIPTPVIDKTLLVEKDQMISIGSQINIGKIYYTLDGSEPMLDSKIYDGPFAIEKNSLLKACTILKDGRKSSIVTSNLLLKKDLPEGKKYGLKYEYYEGEFNSTMPDFDTLQAKSNGYVDYLNFSFPNRRYDQFAVRFTGYLNIEADGEYLFSLTADDGCRIYLNDEKIVATEHYITEPVTGLTELKKGMVPIKIEFYDWGGAESIDLKYKGPGLNLQEIPAYNFFTDAE